MGRWKWDKKRRKRRAAEAEKNRAVTDARRDAWLKGMLDALAALETAIQKGEVQDTPDERMRFIREYSKDPQVVKMMELFDAPPGVDELIRQCDQTREILEQCEQLELTTQPEREVVITTTDGTVGPIRTDGTITVLPDKMIITGRDIEISPP